MLRRKELEVALEQQMASMEDFVDETTLEKRLRAEKLLRERWNFNSEIQNDSEDDYDENNNNNYYNSSNEKEKNNISSNNNFNNSQHVSEWGEGESRYMPALTTVSLPRPPLSKSLLLSEQEVVRDENNNTHINNKINLNESEGGVFRMGKSTEEASKLARAKAVQFLSLRRGQTTSSSPTTPAKNSKPLM